MKKSGIILSLLAFLFPAALLSQQYGFRNFSLEEGLPQTEIQGLIEDSRGILWAGTNGGGLARFNGKSFRVYTIRDGLPDNIIYSLCEDREGNLWIGSMNVISRFDGHAFQAFYEDSTPNFRIYNQVFADNNNRIWAVSFDDQAFIRLVNIENGKIVPVSDHMTELAGGILNVFFARQGTVYITTAEGLYELRDGDKPVRSLLNDYEDLKGHLIIARSQEADGGLILSSFLPGNNRQYFHSCRNGVLSPLEVPNTTWFDAVNLVFRDSQERSWFGSIGNGVAMFDPDIGGFSYFRQDNGLKSDFILGFMEDHEGNIWMGSRGSGMIKYSRNSFVSFNFDNYIDGNMVRDIFQDSRGNLWFGLAAAGLVKYDGSGFTAYSKTNFPGIHNVRGMKEIRPGVLLLASVNGLFQFDGHHLINVAERYGLPPAMAYSDLYDDGDTIWLSSLNLGLARIVNGHGEVFSLQSGHLQSNFYNGIFKDSKGNTWFCSNNGIGKYHDGHFEWYTVEDGLNYPITLQATEDLRGNIWIATYTEGINIFDGEHFSSLTTDDGLNSNNIYSIITDSRGDIWTGTSNGVNRIMLDSNGNVTDIKNYGIYDGFSGIECNGTAIYIDRDENIWFGTVRGAMRYDPRETKPNLNEPQIHITNVGLFFRDVDWRQDDYLKFHSGVSDWYNLPENLVFPYDSNHLTFEFEALSYEVPEKVRYQWKLDGLDKDWSPVSDKTEAVYANIPPGEYTFLVRGMNNDEVWNKTPASFSFVITPPWWGTWYFMLIFTLLVLTAVTLVFRIRIKMIQAKKKELERIVEEKTREVRNQNKLLEQQKEEITAQAERLQTSYTNLENLSEIGKTITSQLSVEKIIDTVYESINKLMDATVFGIGIINKEKNTIDFPGVKEKGETLEFLSFSLDDRLRLSSYCVNTGKEIFINDFEKEYSNYLPAITPADTRSGNSSSILYLPMIINDEITGVITVQSFNKNAYTEYHLNILRNLAVYTKIALENASAYRKIQLQSDDLKKANRDISRQKQKIEESNRELVDLNKEKNHLIGIVAHDLRNPLTSSLAIASKLQSGSPDDKQDTRESLNFLVNALKRMNDMVSKILDISMIEQKKINVKCEKTNLGEIVQDVCQNLQEAARHKNISLNLDNRKAYGMVDRNYLTQVFENLLSNAIKFSPRNSEVRIRVSEENGEIRVNFIDRGPGIREDEMDKLFGKYQKLSARPTGGEDSTGLGLSIVKKYVNVMGGRVWCESEPGKGSNFIVAFRKLK
jgi:signal transduction histidine kinase/ligand-binding sensor domain-containing protein